MGVLNSIPLCARGDNRETDQNNNIPTVSSNLSTSPTTTQPLSLNSPQATSTPRPLSPDQIEAGGGIHNENYDDSLASTGSNSSRERSDSGLDNSADELERRQTFSLDDDEDELQEDDEGVFHEDPLMDETLPIDEENGLEDGVEDPVERPPEPTVPDEALPSDEDQDYSLDHRSNLDKDPTQRAISSLFSELMGDKPIGHSGR